jgi:predicted PhzF superfamily epimerase YddE/YHI9
MDIIVIYSLDVADKGYIAHTRVFAPKFGYLEDPATGSGNSAFGYYMLKYGLWDGSDCKIEQGGNDRMYNSVRLSSLNGRVLFGGGATIRIDGIYYV